MYHPRNPRASPLFQLFETNYETVKAVWEERFERQYGFWQGRWDSAVAAYLDCGLFESGFAIVRCPVCKAQYHVAFSCRCRGLCPSCSAKRAAIFSELLQHQILADMPHAQWVFLDPQNVAPLLSLPARAFRRPRKTRLRDRPRDDGCRHRGARRAARNGRRHPDVWVLIKMAASLIIPPIIKALFLLEKRFLFFRMDPIQIESSCFPNAFDDCSDGFRIQITSPNLPGGPRRDLLFV